MLGRSRLIIFAARALVLLVLLSILWINVASPYNDALATAAGWLMTDDLSVRALGSHLSFEHPNIPPDLTIDGLTLHFGLVLMGVLVLAAVGVGPVARVGWLLALGTGAFVVHVVGVALLGLGLAWAGDEAAPEFSGRLVFSLFAVFWGLIPAVVGGVWCFAYWLPRAARDQSWATRRVAPTSELIAGTRTIRRERQ